MAKYQPSFRDLHYFFEVQTVLGNVQRDLTPMNKLITAVEFWVFLRNRNGSTKEQIDNLVKTSVLNLIRNVRRVWKKGGGFFYSLPQLPKEEGGVKQKYEHIRINWAKLSNGYTSFQLKKGSKFKSYDSFIQNITQFRKICFHYCVCMSTKDPAKIELEEIIAVFAREKTVASIERKITRLTGHTKFQSNVLSFKHELKKGEEAEEEEEDTDDEAKDAQRTRAAQIMLYSFRCHLAQKEIVRRRLLLLAQQKTAESIIQRCLAGHRRATRRQRERFIKANARSAMLILYWLRRNLAWRKELQRKEFALQQNAAQILLYSWRGHLARKELARQKELAQRRKAANIVLCSFRCHMAGKKIAHLRQKRELSVRKLANQSKKRRRVTMALILEQHMYELPEVMDLTNEESPASKRSSQPFVVEETWVKQQLDILKHLKLLLIELEYSGDPDLIPKPCQWMEWYSEMERRDNAEEDQSLRYWRAMATLILSRQETEVDLERIVFAMYEAGLFTRTAIKDCNEELLVSFLRKQRQASATEKAKLLKETTTRRSATLNHLKGGPACHIHVIKIAMALNWVDRPATTRDRTNFAMYQQDVNEQLLDWLPENQLLGLNKLLTSVGQYMHQEVALRKLQDFVSVHLKCSKTALIIKTIEEFYKNESRDTNQHVRNASIEVMPTATISSPETERPAQKPTSIDNGWDRIAYVFSEASSKIARTGGCHTGSKFR